MHIAVIGLGYVGTVTGACLADDGHHVLGVDVSAVKVDHINSGDSPISELGVSELIASNVQRGRLKATQDIVAAVQTSDVTIVSVGTPSGVNGDVHLADVHKVITQIGEALRDGQDWHLVIVTSTVPPGTVEGILVPALEAASGKACGLDFGIVFAPEFLREGSAVADFKHPVNTVIGARDERSAKAAMDVFGSGADHVTTTTVSAAESVKFAANAWHALKVAFSNEIGRFCESHDVDSQEVMRIFKLDSRLNISSTYLTPGFAFGGSCLPKDVRTLTHRARSRGVEAPVLDAILPSNGAHLRLALERIQALGVRRIALLGLAFKSGTDDLRESPSLELAERLLGKGYEITIHDEHVNLSRLVGVNRAYVLERLPHVAQLLEEDLTKALDGAELIVVSQRNSAYGHLMEVVQADQRVLDLTGVARPSESQANYTGLLW